MQNDSTTEIAPASLSDLNQLFFSYRQPHHQFSFTSRGSEETRKYYNWCWRLHFKCPLNTNYFSAHTMCTKADSRALGFGHIGTDAHIRSISRTGLNENFFGRPPEPINHMCEYPRRSYSPADDFLRNWRRLRSRFIDRLNINFRSAVSALSLMPLAKSFIFLLLSCIRHATFFSSLRSAFGVRVRKGKPDSPSSSSPYFAITFLCLSQHGLRFLLSNQLLYLNRRRTRIILIHDLRLSRVSLPV